MCQNYDDIYTFKKLGACKNEWVFGEFKLTSGGFIELLTSIPFSKSASEEPVITKLGLRGKILFSWSLSFFLKLLKGLRKDLVEVVPSAT